MTYKKLKSLLKTSIAINGILFIVIVGCVFALSACTNPTPTEKPKATAEDLQGLIKIVGDAKACSAYRFKDRGAAPRAYMNGMAITFARAVCRQTESDVLRVMAPVSTNVVKDALAQYKSIFADLGMKNDGGVDTLRHVYTLLIGLGMREASGKYCEGRDASAANVESHNAEAGVMQTSYDSRGSSPELPNIFAKYKGKRGSGPCLEDVFSEGVTTGTKKTDHCSASDWKIWGTEPSGKEFQRQQRECPAAAVEYAAVMMRANAGSKGHYGPLRQRKAEVLAACDEMLAKIQAAVEAKPSLCGVL